MEEQKRLCASRDGDLSDLGLKVQAQHGLIQAIAKTQSEHTATLARHTTILDRHTTILDRHTAILDRHTAMHTEHATSLAQLSLNVFSLKDSVQRIVGMLDTLIERGGRQ
ncbi:hypothetical protein [Actinoplanes subglobosus]|uniref:Uncharacterized protein n=1 Tax=Actinoplanes subglobosus TaxID=1547892 RepID=A0ABV8JBB2_9ACTN